MREKEENINTFDELVRYAVIEEKNKREIIMLRGRGCSWRKCRFCDYHLDCCDDEELNYRLNSAQIEKVSGMYKKLEVINSGSFAELDKNSMMLIERKCIECGINELYFECHWNDRNQVQTLKNCFANKNIAVKVKTGVETFDALFRENYLNKGITTDSPSEIAQYFDECCLLQGIPGQTIASMLLDINMGLQYFERVCVNIMQENSSCIKPDYRVINLFSEYIYPVFKYNSRVDILMENTAFGVGIKKV